MTGTLANILMLNYDNYIDTVEEDFLPAKANLPGKVKRLDKQVLKDAINAKFLEGVVSEDMKLYAMDIVFA